MGAYLAQRRLALEDFARTFLVPNELVRLSPATSERWVVDSWRVELAGRGIDGIVAKRIDLPYMAGERTGVLKVKWMHTIDCVVGGFRYAAADGTKSIGELLLGLYDERGILHHVGFCASLHGAERAELVARFEHLIREPGFTGRVPEESRRAGCARTGRGLEAARGLAGRRSAIRSFLGRPIPARRPLRALANGPIAATLHDRSGGQRAPVRDALACIMRGCCSARASSSWCPRSRKSGAHRPCRRDAARVRRHGRRDRRRQHRRDCRRGARPRRRPRRDREPRATRGRGRRNRDGLPPRAGANGARKTTRSGGHGR